MANPLSNLLRLIRAGLVFAQYGVRFVPKGEPVPWPLATLHWLTWPLRTLGAVASPASAQASPPLAAALERLGPSYIKAGQFLATRPDLIGKELASELSGLQDRMEPFSQVEAEKAVERALGRPLGELFASFGTAIAAASIAQVHKAETVATGVAERHPVAVKVLRPGIEERFAADLSSFGFAARTIERFHPPSRRLRPTAVVETLARSMTIELDLRMEASAISEMAENVKNDSGFRVPKVDWARTARQVLTLEWVDGTPIGETAALAAAGHDLHRLGEDVIRHFLRHAMRDGFFHADMHQGNLFVDPAGNIVAVDFGIMGRLSGKERRFLAEILLGFLTRDYKRAAAAHFAAGYVPEKHSVDVFAQALRAIGEPLMDRPAEDISMGHLLGQLFAYTEVFDMETRPELILLQKTMVVVEGVARTLDPRLNIWTAAEPVVKDWMSKALGVEGRLKEAGEGAGHLGQVVADLPLVLLHAERAADAFAGMARQGLRLDEDTVERLAEAQARRGRLGRLALWIGAAALVVLVWWLMRR
jgi:ubiquinone biosynthesis protein